MRINISDIDVLKRKKLKIEIEIATDDKNKETIANQIKLLTEKLEEIESKQQAKKHALAKIDDTLNQSEIGKLWKKMLQSQDRKCLTIGLKIGGDAYK